MNDYNLSSPKMYRYQRIVIKEQKNTIWQWKINFLSIILLLLFISLKTKIQLCNLYATTTCWCCRRCSVAAHHHHHLLTLHVLNVYLKLLFFCFSCLVVCNVLVSQYLFTRTAHNNCMWCTMRYGLPRSRHLTYLVSSLLQHARSSHMNRTQ